jgi:glycogen synthase
LQRNFDQVKIPYVKSTLMPLSSVKSANKVRCEKVVQELVQICQQEKIDLIQCGGYFEAHVAKLVVRVLPHIKVVLTIQTDHNYKEGLFKGLDGVIGVSSRIAQRVEQNVRNEGISLKNITWIIPAFNQDKFLTFKPQYSKKEFFKKNFNLEIHDVPIITMVANFYLNPLWKNHPLLLRVLRKLIYERNRKCQLVFAGVGERMEEIKRLAYTLGIERYVFFLGYTNLIPELLYHSDIKALTGREEALSIALIEAALMKKPMIVTANTGMETIVKHNKTGLLFQDNNMDDLIFQLERLLDHPRWGQRLGNNAYEFVTENFLSDASLRKLEKFYAQVLF